MLKSLLTLSSLTTKEILSLINRAIEIKGGSPIKTQEHKIAINLFFEDSTRTHYSFLTAQHRLNMDVMDFSPNSSSLNKGESFYDTVKTISMMRPELIVLRSSIDRWYKQLDNINAHFINAGDGVCDHPSQTLLDLMTIYENFNHKLEGLVVLIVGDILHSRVARSNYDAMTRLGMKVLFCAPKEFQDPQYQYVDFATGIQQANVINLLRIQNERLTKSMSITTEQYNHLYGLNHDKLQLMKKDAIIIHPAPVNRGVEIDNDLVEHKQSRIFQQMENGVFVRIAMIEYVLS